MKKVLIWIDRLHWLWLLLAAPFLLFPNPKRSLVMLVVPASWILQWIVKRQNKTSPVRSNIPLPLSPLNSTLLVMAIMVLVSIWASYDIAFSLPKISGMVLAFGVFFAYVRLGARPKNWWRIFMFFLVAGVGVAGLGLIGTDWFIDKFNILDPITSRIPLLIEGLQGAEAGFHPNEVAGALTWVLPVFTVLSIYSMRSASRQMMLSPDSSTYTEQHQSERKVKTERFFHIDFRQFPVWLQWVLLLSLWLATIFILAVFVFAQSRGGYIGFAFSMMGILFIALPKRWRIVFLGLLVIGGVVIGFVFSEENFVQVRDWIIGSEITTGRGLSINTLEGRMEIWSRAIYGLQDLPFTGMGMNAFREVVHLLYPLLAVAPNTDLGHAHNELLQAGLDLGIPGMVGFIAIYVGAFWMLTRIWLSVSARKFQKVENLGNNLLIKVLVLGLGGGLASHMIYGITDAVALGAKPGFLFWMILGLIASLHEQCCSRQRNYADAFPVDET